MDAGCHADRLLPEPAGLDYERFQRKQRLRFNCRFEGAAPIAEEAGSF